MYRKKTKLGQSSGPFSYYRNEHYKTPPSDATAYALGALFWVFMGLVVLAFVLWK